MTIKCPGKTSENTIPRCVLSCHESRDRREDIFVVDQDREVFLDALAVIPAPKEKNPKLVGMLEKDIELYKSMPIGFFVFLNNIFSDMKRAMVPLNPAPNSVKIIFINGGKKLVRNLAPYPA